MARINSRLRTEIAFDGLEAGEGLAIFLSQNGDALARYRFLVKAITSQGDYQVGEFYSSPPLATLLPGRLTRMVAGAVCSGATSWTVEVSGMPLLEDGELINVSETADVILTSSKCFSPIGVSRVGERYQYATGSSPGGTQDFTVLAGRVITGIAAYGLAGGGTIAMPGVSAGVVTVPAGASANLQPGASVPPNSLVTLGNADWVIEYLESA